VVYDKSMSADRQLTGSPAMEEALAAVYDRSEGGTTELVWSDVSDDLSSEQWHSLIEQEVLVSAGDGFVLSNPGDIETQLNGTERPQEPVTLDGWQRTDKLAGVVVLALSVGYFLRPLRQVIASTEDTVFGLLADLLPFYWVVLVLAAATSLYLLLLQERLLDHERLDRYHQQHKRVKIRRQAAKARGDEETLDRLDREHPGNVRAQVEMTKLRLRPTVWSLWLTIPVFLWLRWTIGGGRLAADTGLVLPFAGSVAWQQPLIGPIQAWLVWYFVGSVATQQFVEKVFDIGSSLGSS
jgi:uncharacterized membrane protein (DUF106 family)